MFGFFSWILFIWIVGPLGQAKSILRKWVTYLHKVKKFEFLSALKFLSGI